MNPKRTKVIFFITGPVPTDEQRQAADALMTGRRSIVFRNAVHIVPGEALEACDAVAGDVPDLYKDYPRVEVAATVANSEVPPPPPADSTPPPPPAVVPPPKGGKAK